MPRLLKSPVILISVLFPLFFALHGYSDNFSFIPENAIAVIFGKYLVFSFLLAVIFYLLYRDPYKTAAAVFITSFIYYFFGFIQDLLKGFSLTAPVSRYSILLPAMLILYLTLLWLIRKKKISSRVVNPVILLLAIWIVIDTVSVSIKFFQPSRENIMATACHSCPRPDVYLILVDGYAGEDQLKDEFEFDNKSFLDSLRKLGFQLPSTSRADYSRTEFSVSSMLQMRYHHLKNFAVTPASLKYCSEKIAVNPVVSMFRQLGYRFVNNSIFDIDDQEAPVSNSFLLNGRARMERATLLGRIKNDIWLNFLGSHYPQSRLYQNVIQEYFISDKKIEERLLKFADDSAAPKFIYSHLLYTHCPYYFKANGQPNPDSLVNLRNYERKDLYLGNLQASGNRMLNLVNKLEETAKRPSIIILMSDHGFRYGKPLGSLSNLLAIKTPAGIKLQLPDTMRNVNIFREVFSQVYQQKLPPVTP